MRIAYLCQSYPPMISGAAIVVKRLAEEMAARGHSILVISASASCKQNISHSSGIRHLQLRSFKNPKRVGQTFTLFSGKSVEKCLTRFKPDILHTHDPFWLGLSGLTSSRRLGIPTVITLHQLPWFIAAYLPEFPGLRGLTEKGFWGYGDWLLQQFDRVIIPSQATAEVVCENTSCQPIVISNGMDLSRFSPLPDRPDEREYLHAKSGLDPSKPIILHVGRLDVDKNVTTLIRAAARAMVRGESQLLVVGDGCQRQVLEQLCKDLGIAESTHFLGYVDQNGDLPGLYRQATVFATASEIEIQGTVILEAMASGVPVVAVRATSMQEFVLDSVNGHLVQPGSVRQLGDCLARLLCSPERAREMGKAGRDLVSKHAISNSVRRHEELYQDLIQESVIT